MMTTIEALNAKTSAHQRGWRLTVWGGSESNPGSRSDTIVYATTLTAAVSRAVRAWRRGIGRGRVCSDWTITVEPLRAHEQIIVCPSDHKSVSTRGKPFPAKTPAQEGSG